MARKSVTQVGGGIVRIKMTADPAIDIDRVYDAANYMSALADYLIEELQVRSQGTDIFIDAMDVQTEARRLVNCAEKMRNDYLKKHGGPWNG